MGFPIWPASHLPQEINGPAIGDDGGPLFFVVSARSASPAGRLRPVTSSGGERGAWLVRAAHACLHIDDSKGRARSSVGLSHASGHGIGPGLPVCMSDQSGQCLHFRNRFGNRPPFRKPLRPVIPRNRSGDQGIRLSVRPRLAWRVSNMVAANRLW